MRADTARTPKISKRNGSCPVFVRMDKRRVDFVDMVTGGRFAEPVEHPRRSGGNLFFQIVNPDRAEEFSDGLFKHGGASKV